MTRLRLLALLVPLCFSTTGCATLVGAAVGGAVNGREGARRGARIGSAVDQAAVGAPTVRRRRRAARQTSGSYDPAYEASRDPSWASPLAAPDQDFFCE
ncbi:MAG: hypothetical protein AAGE52_06865 [Myxococcota bacterium]